MFTFNISDLKIIFFSVLLKTLILNKKINYNQSKTNKLKICLDNLVNLC